MLLYAGRVEVVMQEIGCSSWIDKASQKPFFEFICILHTTFMNPIFVLARHHFASSKYENNLFLWQNFSLMQREASHLYDIMYYMLFPYFVARISSVHLAIFGMITCAQHRKALFLDGSYRTKMKTEKKQFGAYRMHGPIRMG